MEIKLNTLGEEQISVLFQPDALLSEQYFAVYRRGTHLEPEKSLMMAVLEDAIDCFQKYLRARDKRGKTLFHEAEEWIFQKDPEWLFSFDNVCDTLGLQPEFLRRGLRRWKEMQHNGGSNGLAGGTGRSGKRRGRYRARLPSAA